MSKNERYEDPAWLRKKYYEEEKTLFEIARECSVDPVAVYDAMDENGIKTWTERGFSHPKDTSCGYDRMMPKPVGHKASGSDPSEKAEDERSDRRNVDVYGEGWNPSKKQKVRARDGFRCVDCGVSQKTHKERYSERLHVHHLTKAREVDDADVRNSTDNLVTLCNGCHKKWERIAKADIDLKVDKPAGFENGDGIGGVVSGD